MSTSQDLPAENEGLMAADEVDSLSEAPTGARRFVLLILALLGLVLVWRIGGSLLERPATPQGFGGAATAVRAAAIEQGTFERLSTYPGEIVAEVTDISPEVSGILKAIPARIGDRVKSGQVLAIINDVNLRNQNQEAQGQLGVAEANERRVAAELEHAEAEHHRAAELRATALLSQAEFDRVESQLATAAANVAAAEAQTAQAKARLALLARQLADSRVTAPFDGVIADRYVDPGTLVQPGTPILRLVQEDALRVQFRVPERDLGIVRAGVGFESTTVATGKESFAGVVKRVAGEVSRTDRTAIVEGELTTRSEVLMHGMYAEVQVQLERLERALLVPSSAVVSRVLPDGSQSTGIFVTQQDEGEKVEASAENGERAPSTARWVDVTVLGNRAGRSAIVGEVAPGALALTMGHADLRDGAPVRVVQVEGEAS